MTLKVAVVGAPGSGKTLFCINWCEYLGAARIYYHQSNGTGKGGGIIIPQAARSKMVWNSSRCSGYTYVINRPGKVPSRLVLADTFCFRKDPELNTVNRTRLIITLQMLSWADVILNVVDLTCGDPSLIEFAGEIDRCLFEFSIRHPVRYNLVGNKVDLFSRPPEIPWWPTSSVLNVISALKGTGFDQLTRQIINSEG